MRSLVRFIAVATLVCLLVPGLGEAAENLWHVVRTGHSAHDLSAGEQRELPVVEVASAIG